MNVHVLYVFEHKTSKKKSVCMSVWSSGCMYVNFACGHNNGVKFFGVKFDGDYYYVAIISILYWDHSQKSEKPNFWYFFRLLTVIPK